VLAVLVHANQQFQRQGRAIACVTRAGPVQGLLDATGLRDALHAFSVLEDAAAHVLRNEATDRHWPSSPSDRTQSLNVGMQSRDETR
jgi:hypothetical protein